MKATIIKASELKVGDRFLTRDRGIDTIVKAQECIDEEYGDRKYISIRSKGMHPLSSASYSPSDEVARIDPDEPEPVEVREKFSVIWREYGVKYSSQPQADYDSAKRYAGCLPSYCTGIDIEHVRETVLSRETVLPEGDKS